jgi:hypothetical protein
MNKLYSKINNLQDSYHLEQAENNGEAIARIKKGECVIDAFYNYCYDNNIDLSNVSDSEKDSCLDLLQSMLDASEDGFLTFSISN